MNWVKLENIIGEKVPGCVKKVLDVCGYDTLMSIFGIKDDSISQIEDIMNGQFGSTIQSFDCSHAEYYKQQTRFRFLPGHADFLRAISKLEFPNSNNEAMNESTPTLQAMVNEFQNATGRNRAKYSDFVRYFATYIFLKAGRSCYEFLNSNLPLPSVKTVCKYIV